MEIDSERLCGCKGIRSCLICEEVKGLKQTSIAPNNEECTEYFYCYLCDLCWPSKSHFSNFHAFHSGDPLYVAGVNLIPEFVTEQEEAWIVSNIDLMPWAASQSGRRKQDFGPKVNFKKHKVKPGNFCGFPSFTSSILQRLNEVPALTDFRPVELCHLDYNPERGSAIEPHVDDSWLWGERLVTISLLSDTVLSLSPLDQMEYSMRESSDFDLKFSNEMQDPLTLKDACRTKLSLNYRYSPTDSSKGNPIQESQPYNGISLSGLENQLCDMRIEKRDESVSSELSESRSQPIVHIHLPARSLLTLTDSARYLWKHAIARDNIRSRRIAMTFRELSIEFMEGGLQEKVGKELLGLAKVLSE